MVTLPVSPPTVIEPRTDPITSEELAVAMRVLPQKDRSKNESREMYMSNPEATRNQINRVLSLRKMKKGTIESLGYPTGQKDFGSMNHAEFEREFDEVMDVMRARAAEGTRVELAEKARPFGEGEIAGEDFGAGFVSVPQPVVAQPVTPPIKPEFRVL